MKTSTTLIKFALVIILVSSSTIICNALGDGNDTFDCKGGQATAVTGNQGFLSIKRGVDPCVFESKSGTKFFVIQTDNLDLKGKDSLTVEDIVGNNTKEFEGAQEEGYIVIGLANFALKFAFDASIKNESVIKVRFFQDPTPTPTLPVSGDRKRDLVIQNIGQLKYNLGIEKSIADPVYLDSVIARRLILKGSEAVPVEFSEDKVLSLSLSPALNECSGYHATKDGERVDIQGPDVTILNKRESYKCVHLFESSDKSHHDVDFKNFAGMLDDSDELSIIDASGTLKVTRSNQAEYNGLLSAVSSKDQKLAVVYDSPEKISRIQAQFKLSVHTRLLGGVIDKFDSKLDIPSKGSVIYSLRTPPTGSVVNLEFDKLSGVQMKIYNRHNQVFSVDTSTASLTTSIPFDKPNGDISVEFSAVANKKISGSVNYKPGSDCSGTLFESSGTIAFKGTNKTCYWFLGAQTNLLNINLNDLEAGGSLEIYAGGRLEPIFHSDNMASTEVLPPMVLENPAYLKIKLGSPTNSFGATLSPVEKSQASSRSQATITSIGYPNSYQWSANPESYSFNFTETKNKEFVLSVADLDLRPGETMTIDSKAVASDTVPVDIDLKTKTINMSIQRSYNGGFSTHRGYKLVTTAFDQLIVANMTASVLTTPQNLTSVLIRIPGGAKQRISYTITATNDTNQVIQVIDSKSLMGRQATDGLNSSSTSNELLVSVRSSNPKTTLPQIKVEYSQTPCDEAKDHMCDGSTRCVPADKMCKGVGYCADGSDLKVPCSSGSSPLPPPIPPKVIEAGVGGVTVFILSVLMFSLGAVAALYGPDLYKNFQTRFRSGQYTTFQSTE